VSNPGSPRPRADDRRGRGPAIPNAPGSRLLGFIEHPHEGDVVERRLTMSGWHAWDGEPVAAVTVEIAGRVVGRASSDGLRRDDVAVELGDPRLASSGWRADLDLGALQGDRAVLETTVYPSATAPAVRLAPITLIVEGAPTRDADGHVLPLPDAVLGVIDEPRPAATVSRGLLRVQGWARATRSPASSVRVRANGVDLGRARIGLARPDVAAVDGHPFAPVCGFELHADLAGLSLDPGGVELTAEVACVDGTTATLRSSFDLDGRDPATPTDAADLKVPAAREGPLRLLVVTHDLGYGGAQLWLHELLVGARAGEAFDCTVVAMRGGPLAERLEALGIDVHVTTVPPVDDARAYEGRLAELGAWLEGREPTAALVNTFRAFAGADVAERLGIPVVWAIHESWPESVIWSFDHPGVAVDPKVRGIAARALRGARAVVFESAATRDLYADRAAERSIVIPYGVDVGGLGDFAATTGRDEARAALGLAPEGRILTVMGTIEPRKAQCMIVTAFALLADRHRAASLVLIGDVRTEYSDALLDLVARSGLDGRVRVEAVTDDAATWYRASDVLVCGSDVESLPRSVLEAMAMGIPVVATRVFGLAELLDDGVTGMLFEDRDLTAMLAALDRALSSSDEELRALGTRGRDLVRAHNDAEGYARDVLALLRGLSADPRAMPGDVLARSDAPVR